MDLRKAAGRGSTAEHVIRLFGKLDRPLRRHPGNSRAISLYQAPACDGVHVRKQASGPAFIGGAGSDDGKLGLAY